MQSCTGQCEAGYYCPIASTSATAFPCSFGVPGQPESVFCPAGSSSPLPVTVGYYSTDGASGLRSAQSACPPGSYCVAGVQAPCPGGYFGATPRLSSSSCSGKQQLCEG